MEEQKRHYDDQPSNNSAQRLSSVNQQQEHEPADVYQQQTSSSSWHRGATVNTTTGFSVGSKKGDGNIIQILDKGHGTTLFERMDHSSVLSDRKTASEQNWRAVRPFDGGATTDYSNQDLVYGQSPSHHHMDSALTNGSGGGEIRIKDFLIEERNKEAASSTSKIMAFQRREEQAVMVNTSRTSKAPRNKADIAPPEAGILKIKKVRPSNEAQHSDEFSPKTISTTDRINRPGRIVVKRSGPTVNCETRDLIYRDYTDDMGSAGGGLGSSSTSARVAHAKKNRKVRNDNSGSDRGTRRRIIIPPADKVQSPLVKQVMANVKQQQQRQPAASNSMAYVTQSSAVSGSRHLPQDMVNKQRAMRQQARTPQRARFQSNQNGETGQKLAPNSRMQAKVSDPATPKFAMPPGSHVRRLTQMQKFLVPPNNVSPNALSQLQRNCIPRLQQVADDGTSSEQAHSNENVPFNEQMVTTRSISAGGVHQSAPRVSKKGAKLTDAGHQRYDAPVNGGSTAIMQADEYNDNANTKLKRAESSSSLDSAGPAVTSAARNMSMKKAKRNNYTRPRHLFKPLAIDDAGTHQIAAASSSLLID